MNPTEDQIKIITEGYTKAFKEANPGYISPKEFEELRFKKANVRLTDREFAEVLNIPYQPLRQQKHLLFLRLLGHVCYEHLCCYLQ